MAHTGFSPGTIFFYEFRLRQCVTSIGFLFFLKNLFLSIYRIFLLALFDDSYWRFRRLTLRAVFSLLTCMTVDKSKLIQSKLIYFCFGTFKCFFVALFMYLIYVIYEWITCVRLIFQFQSPKFNFAKCILALFIFTNLWTISIKCLSMFSYFTTIYVHIKYTNYVYKKI